MTVQTDCKELTFLPILGLSPHNESHEISTLQSGMLRIYDDAGVPSWTVIQARVPQEIDTVLVGKPRLIMRLCGRLINIHDGSLYLKTKLLERYQTKLPDAPIINSDAINITCADCLTLQDGRLFLINSEKENLINIFQSLNIPFGK